MNSARLWFAAIPSISLLIVILTDFKWRYDTRKAQEESYLKSMFDQNIKAAKELGWICD